MNNEQILLNLFESVIPPKEKTAKQRVDTGIAQAASTTDAPWEVLLLDGGVVYASVKIDGATWALADKLLLVQGGDSWGIIGKWVGG